MNEPKDNVPASAPTGAERVAVYCDPETARALLDNGIGVASKDAAAPLGVLDGVGKALPTLIAIWQLAKGSADLQKLLELVKGLVGAFKPAG